MKIKVKKNGTFDVTIQYRVIMAQEILDAAKLANMNPADLMLAAFHMMMDFAVQDPKEFSKAAKGFITAFVPWIPTDFSFSAGFIEFSSECG